MGKLDKGKILSNLDNTLTPEQIRDGEETERVNSIIEDGWKKPKSGQGAHRAPELLHDNEKLVVTEEQAQDTEEFVATSVNVLEHWGYRIDPQTPFGIVWTVSQAGLMSIEEGRHCGQCLHLQSQTKKDHHCEWPDGTRQCNSTYNPDLKTWHKADDPRYNKTLILPHGA